MRVSKPTAVGLLLAMTVSCQGGSHYSCGQPLHPDEVREFLARGDAEFIASFAQVEAESAHCPDDAGLLPFLFYGNLRLENEDSALVSYERIATKERIAPDLHADAGFVYSDRGEFDSAARSLSQAISQESSADLLLERGKAYVALKQYDLAIRDLEAVFALAKAHDPQEVPGWTSIGDDVYLEESGLLLVAALAEHGRRHDAAAVLDELLVRNPGNRDLAEKRSALDAKTNDGN